MAIRKLRIKGTWLIDGTNYTGRTIDMDNLSHLSWHDDVPATFSVEAAGEALRANPSPWEQNFLHSVLEQFASTSTISEKQNAVWDRIALKMGIVEPDQKQKDARGSLGDLPTGGQPVSTDATTFDLPF